MKTLILIILSFLSVTSYAEDKSERLNQLMIDSKVEAHGKRQYRVATIHCKLDMCKLYTVGGDDFIDIYREFHGYDVADIRELMTEFGILPWGKKKQILEAKFSCSVKKRTQTLECEDLEYPMPGFSAM